MAIQGITFLLLLIKIVTNIISIGVRALLLLLGTNLIEPFGPTGINLITFHTGGLVNTGSTIFFVAAFYPILGVFVFLMISSMGRFKKTKGISICLVLLIFIALLKTDSWLSHNAWLLYLITFSLLYGSTIFLAENRYE